MFVASLSACCNMKKSGNVTGVDSKSDSNNKVGVFSSAAAEPITTWLRQNPAELGCVFEETIGYRDAKFNCDYGEYVNNGDPCVNTDEYYEGFNLPESVTKNICPVISSIKLAFEHGELRSIFVQFNKELSTDEMLTYFALPKSESELPENVMSITLPDGANFYEAGNTRFSSITLIAFEHIGAGEVDCD